MLLKPILGSQMSGSLAGITASHNAGGQYLRQRVKPTDPATSNQVFVRNAVGSLAARWSSTLTDAQRLAWTVYAANVPLINRIGESRPISGIAQYIRSNTPRLQAGKPIVDDGPMTYTLAEISGMSYGITADNPGSTFDTFFDITDQWAIEAGGFLFVYLSRPQNLAINFFKGPYQLALTVVGASPTPPTSPVAGTTAPFAFASNMKVFFQMRAATADGRLSTPFRGSAVSS
jgi:hypothetical protein